MLYLCTEDSVSGIKFWKFICANLFQNIEIIDLGKNSNNTKLADFVCGLTDKENTYLICYDIAFDNMEVMNTYSQIIQYIKTNNMTNIKLLDVISFEYALLSFSELENWCFATVDEFKEKRKEFLECRKILLNTDDLIDYRELSEIKKFVEKHPKASTIERVCSRLLFQITRNTGFVVDKGVLGDCWYKNCCLLEREDDDKCGMEETGFLTNALKALVIFEKSCLKESFARLGIEVEVSIKNEIIFENRKKNGDSIYDEFISD